MRFRKLGTTGVLLLCVSSIAADQPQSVGREKTRSTLPPTTTKNATIKAFMRKKLVAADQILEGLTTADMSRVRKGADSMIQMNKEAMWATFKSPTYTQDSADFVRSAQRLDNLARKDDLEGASYTYAQLTIQCVRCHRRVQTQSVARFDDSSKSALAVRNATRGTTKAVSVLNRSGTASRLQTTQPK